MAFPCAPEIPALPGVFKPPPFVPQLPPPVIVDNIVVQPPIPDMPPIPPPVDIIRPRFVSQLVLTSPHTILWLATLCRASYLPLDQVLLFNRAVNVVFGSSGYSLTFVPNVELVPGYAIIKIAHGAIVVISGTTNLGQWQEQLFAPKVEFTKVTPPGPTGGLGTLQVWATAASAIWTALGPLVPNDQQILFVGHSMGGAVAELLHAVADKHPNTRTPSRCFTFAAPKPGDQRLQAFSRTQYQVYRRVFDEGDVVPSLPPDLGILHLAAPEIFRPRVASWATFKHPGNGYAFDGNGRLQPADDSFLPTQVAVAMIRAAAGNPLALLDAHMPKRYVDAALANVINGNDAAPSNWYDPTELIAVNAELGQKGY